MFLAGAKVKISPASKLASNFRPFHPVSYTHLDVYKRQGIIALATACSSQSTTAATTAASTTAETTAAAVKENTTAAEKETTAAEKAEGKKEADSKASENSSERCV